MRVERLERVLLASGLTLLAIWVAARGNGAIASRLAIARFEALNTPNSPADFASTLPDPVLGSRVDFHLWSVKRIAAYEDSLIKKTEAPLAILRIPRINLEAPIFNDTDDLTLNRGVGRILGTAQIGEVGNLGIAGHRDGFFRGLQRMVVGDVIKIARPRRVDLYTVSQIRVVAPDDVSVLNPTATSTLTLVTCFPFYFVGRAPYRYIVTAVFQSAYQAGLGADEDIIFTGSNNKLKEEKR